MVPTPEDAEIAARWRDEFVRRLKAKAPAGLGHYAEGATLDDSRQALLHVWPGVAAGGDGLVSATARNLLKHWFEGNGLAEDEADDVVSEMENGA